MTNGAVVNPAAIEPLFETWEEPNAHRVRPETPGAAVTRVKGRRRSDIIVAQNLRGEVRQWREAHYAGASDTTRYLLAHWFERSHRQTTPAGEEFEFRYYFCQREAIETLIYLKEVRRLECLSQVIHEFGGPDAETAALGIEESEDEWSRYAFKIATGAGKTKVMSLAIVWSYFHALRESDSAMARHFVAIAPNLTVFERLKEDFRPHGGGPDIFLSDPLIPPEWLGDWNLSVVLQDEASGAASGGTLYLTNIHRLYDISRRKKADEPTYDWIGPPVSKAKALDTGAELRDRITNHRRVMLVNDEAHHVWDPDSAWNEAIRYLHETIRKRTGGGLCAQLDFTATPKDNRGQVFKHVVCDSPLGEAVDGGIVKTPVIGRGGDLHERADDNAAFKYDMHLRLGYARWKASREEWRKSGKKPLLFVMCEDTTAADQIWHRLNTDPTFGDLNGKTINLHTNLKGKVKKVGRGKAAYEVFVENEKEISDEDLEALRRLSRELDRNSSPYLCIVSVLMLREGWDVRNVTTIVPLRPYSSKANILPEQTLGRGLRRMTPPGQAHELVTVVDHPAFASLYRQELSQEGLHIEIVDPDKVPATTVSIFPDEAGKDLKALEILLPQLAAAHRTLPTLEGLTIEDVKGAFEKFKKLPAGETGETERDYEGRHLFTGEIVEQMKVHLPLMESGIGAVSYFVKELEAICKVRGMHPALAPLIQTFLEEILFEEKTSLFDSRLVSRLSNSDVQEHVRAVFVPLIRARTTTTEVRTKQKEAISLATWRPFQVTHSERRPAIPAKNTLFNLVPCNRELEVAVARFADNAPDVVAFAKNAGPQCLRIDYLAGGGRLAFYTPDFFIRRTDGHYLLVETKGREDRDVPAKARAAVAWCKAASTRKCRWSYLYVPQGVFERLSGNTVTELARTCEPALQDLVSESVDQLALPGFDDEEAPAVEGFIGAEQLSALPPRYAKAVEQAVILFSFLENKDMDFSPVFQALLGSMDDAAKGMIVRRLSPALPDTVQAQKDWFAPYMGDVNERAKRQYQAMALNLKRTLVFNNGLSPIGLLRFCLDYALNDSAKLDGVFVAVKEEFRFSGGRKFLDRVTTVNGFRNNYVAHQEKELKDRELAERELRNWIETIGLLSEPMPNGRSSDRSSR